MAAENCLIGAMDRLWFHQIILLSEPSLLHLAEDPTRQEPSSKFSSKNSSGMSVISEQEEATSVASVVATRSQDWVSSQESDDRDKKTTHHDDQTPRVSNLVPGRLKARYQSSSPISSPKRSRILPRFQKTMSCQSLADLELEEVKGFIDLGFVFRKENLSKRVINLIPGLQRIDDYCKNEENNNDEENGATRPYLSEAWLVKRSDSPLPNLRIPRVSTADDMKKHLKSWAQTVASAVLQES